MVRLLLAMAHPLVSKEPWLAPLQKASRNAAGRVIQVLLGLAPVYIRANPYA